jgi:predicted  nucleic acid-binding Zn-ribbon protein
MVQKTIYLCSNCRTEWAEHSSKQKKGCPVCGCTKIYRSSHHQRYAKKSRSKVRWSYKV